MRLPNHSHRLLLHTLVLERPSAVLNRLANADSDCVLMEEVDTIDSSIHIIIANLNILHRVMLGAKLVRKELSSATAQEFLRCPELQQFA